MVRESSQHEPVIDQNLLRIIQTSNFTLEREFVQRILSDVSWDEFYELLRMTIEVVTVCVSIPFPEALSPGEPDLQGDP